MIELLSIDLSNYCSKQCSFCYNHSTRAGNTLWKPQEVIAFASDCIRNGGVKAVSLGGGEPFEYEGVFEIVDTLFPCAICRSPPTGCLWKTLPFGTISRCTNPTKSTLPSISRATPMRWEE